MEEGGSSSWGSLVAQTAGDKGSRAGLLTFVEVLTPNDRTRGGYVCQMQGVQQKVYAHQRTAGSSLRRRSEPWYRPLSQPL